ncbi:MAG: hypothetical protein DLM61_22455 [Pseudonocardiales bacterium]|nr:MAG: hypothetical protein DLM61_22455 [Pseudonocardiales bacterium]
MQMQQMQQIKERERARRRRRRLSFAAGVLVPVAIIVAVLIATSGGKHKGPQGKANASTRLPKLGGSFAYSSIGVSGSLPKGWRATQNARGSLVRLTSADRGAVIAIGTDRAATNPKGVLDSALSTARSTYHPQRVQRLPRARLGGLPAQDAVLFGRNRGGVPIRVLLASARGRKLTYLLEVFTAQASPALRLLEAQQILLALRLTG